MKTTAASTATTSATGTITDTFSWPPMTRAAVTENTNTPTETPNVRRTIGSSRNRFSRGDRLVKDHCTTRNSSEMTTVTSPTTPKPPATSQSVALEPDTVDSKVIWGTSRPSPTPPSTNSSAITPARSRRRARSRRPAGARFAAPGLGPAGTPPGGGAAAGSAGMVMDTQPPSARRRPHHFTSRRGGFHRPDGMKDRSLPVQEPQLAGPRDRLAAGGGAQLAVDRVRLRLDGVAGQEQFPADLRERQVGGEQRQQAQLGGAQRRGSRGGRTPGLGKLRPQVLGLPGEYPQARAPREDLAGLADERPGGGQVGERQVDAGQLDSGLNGEVGKRVGQARPQPLRPGQLLQGARPVALVQRHPRGHRMHDRDRGVVPEVGLTGQ